jgi:hypothetical protein
MIANIISWVDYGNYINYSPGSHPQTARWISDASSSGSSFDPHVVLGDAPGGVSPTLFCCSAAPSNAVPWGICGVELLP